MNIKQYDKVLLKDGTTAFIVEIFDDGSTFVADINKKSGTDTDWIKLEDIYSIID